MLLIAVLSALGFFFFGVDRAELKDMPILATVMILACTIVALVLVVPRIFLFVACIFGQLASIAQLISGTIHYYFPDPAAAMKYADLQRDCAQIEMLLNEYEKLFAGRHDTYTRGLEAEKSLHQTQLADVHRAHAEEVARLQDEHLSAQKKLEAENRRLQRDNKKLQFELRQIARERQHAANEHQRQIWRLENDVRRAEDAHRQHTIACKQNQLQDALYRAQRRLAVQEDAHVAELKAVKAQAAETCAKLAASSEGAKTAHNIEFDMIVAKHNTLKHELFQRDQIIADLEQDAANAASREQSLRRLYDNVRRQKVDLAGECARTASALFCANLILSNSGLPQSIVAPCKGQTQAGIAQPGVAAC
ncbi:hypothetical protein HDZ31DRAFT_70113 [Schizophyllum fasciatum]